MLQWQLVYHNLLTNTCRFVHENVISLLVRHLVLGDPDSLVG